MSESKELITPEELIAKFGNQKIQAIKYYREQSGADLKAAKDFVDAAYLKVQIKCSPDDIDLQKLIERFGERKVLAIRYIMDQTGLSLAEAKKIADKAYNKPISQSFNKPVSQPYENRDNVIPKKKAAYKAGPEIKDQRDKKELYFLLVVTLLIAGAMMIGIIFDLN